MSVPSDDAKLYYNLSGASGGTWVELVCSIEDTISIERRKSGDVVCRGDAEVGEHVGKPKWTLSGRILAKKATPGVTYTAMRAAVLANTKLGICASSGDKAVADNWNYFSEMKISKWEESRADNGYIEVSWEAVRDAGSTYDSNVAVVSA